MPDTVEDLLGQLNSAKDALNSCYIDGELSKCDDLNTDAWSLFGRYMLALAERETFENLRDSFAEKYAAVDPNKEAKDLPERINSLLSQIDTQLAEIDIKADSLDYDQATKDLNALITGKLADLQKAIASYDAHYTDYNENHDDVIVDYDLYMANIGLYPESLNAMGKRIVDAHSAMTKAEEAGDYEKAFNQQKLLVAALEEAETGLESHNAGLKAQYDKRAKELDDRWQKLLDANPLKASGGANATNPDDDTQKLENLGTEIVNGFAEAVENAKQPPYDLAFEELDKVETSLDAYNAELASLEKAATDAQDTADYLALKEDLAPRITEAVDLPYETLKAKNQPIHDHYGKAEAFEADDLYIDAYNELLKVQIALDAYEKALAALDDKMMEFTDKEDEWKKTVAKNWSIIQRYSELESDWETFQADVLEAASNGDFSGADSKMDLYLMRVKFAVYGDLDPVAFAAREMKEGKESGFDAERREIERMRISMNNEAVAGDYEMALGLMWDLKTAIDDLQTMLDHHAHNVKTRKKKTNDWIRSNSETRVNNIAVDIGLAKSKFNDWVKKRDDFNYAGDWGFLVIQSLIGLVAGTFGTPVLGFAATLAVGALGKAVGLKDNLELDLIANSERIASAADKIAGKWLEFDVDKFGPYLMKNHAVLWDNISDALKETNNLDPLDYLDDAGIPRDNPKYMATLLKRMQDKYLTQVIEQIDHFEEQETPK